MNTVDITDLSKEILTSKDESAMLVGISWAETLPEDPMVRFLVIHPDQSLDAASRSFLLFMHKVTRLNIKDGEKLLAHQGPEDLDINHTVIVLDGTTYGIAQRMTGSWGFFTQTHTF